MSEEEQTSAEGEEAFVYSSHGSELLEKLYNLAKEGSFCDAALVSNERIGAFIPVHKAIIVGASPVLERRFRNGVRSVSVDLPSHTVRKLIRFFYTGEISITLSDFIDIEKSACILQLSSLKEMCMMYREKYSTHILHPPPTMVEEEVEKSLTDGFISPENKDNDPTDITTTSAIEGNHAVGFKRIGDPIDQNDAKRQNTTSAHTIYVAQTPKSDGITSDGETEDPLVFRCLYCRYYSRGKSSQMNLKKHMQHHVKSGKYNCAVCSFSTDTNPSLSRHLSNHHIESDFEGLPENTDFTKMYPDEALSKPHPQFHKMTGEMTRTVALPVGTHNIVVGNESYTITIPEAAGRDKLHSVTLPKNPDGGPIKIQIPLDEEDHSLPEIANKTQESQDVEEFSEKVVYEVVSVEEDYEQLIDKDREEKDTVKKDEDISDKPADQLCLDVNVGHIDNAHGVDDDKTEETPSGEGIQDGVLHIVDTENGKMVQLVPNVDDKITAEDPKNENYIKEPAVGNNVSDYKSIKQEIECRDQDSTSICDTRPIKD